MTLICLLFFHLHWACSLGGLPLLALAIWIGFQWQFYSHCKYLLYIWHGYLLSFVFVTKYIVEFWILNFEGNNDVNWCRHINACSKKAKQVEEKKKQKIKNQLKKSSSAGKRKTVDTSGCAKHFDLKYCLGRIQKWYDHLIPLCIN